MSNVNGSIKVFQVLDDGQVAPSHTLALPPANAPRQKGRNPQRARPGFPQRGPPTRLYVCGNLSNQLLELDTATGEVLRRFDVGVAPYDVVLHHNLALVSNWGGRRPREHDTTGPAGRGTTVRVDPVRHIASEGSVSIVDLESGAVDEVRHRPACQRAGGKSRRRIPSCANAADDNVSVR